MSHRQNENYQRESPADRNVAIDVMKGVLTLFMVAAHTFQFLAKETHGTRIVSDSANLVCMPGFLFCFGYVCYGAYLQPGARRVADRLGRTVLKLLGAYLVSAIAMRILMSPAAWTTSLVDICTLSDVPGYSEFLLTFALTVLLAGILRRPLVRVAVSEIATAVTILTLFSLTLIPYDRVPERLGLILGSPTKSYFPVLQYFPLFLLGMNFAIHNRRMTGRGTSVAAAVLTTFVVYLILGGSLPTRFPPSLGWMLLSLPAVGLIGSFSQYVASRRLFLRVQTSLSAVGSNALFYLLASNLILFSLRANQPEYRTSTWEAGLAFVGIMALIGFLITIIQPAHRRAGPKPSHPIDEKTWKSLATST